MTRTLLLYGTFKEHSTSWYISNSLMPQLYIDRSMLLMRHCVPPIMGRCIHLLFCSPMYAHTNTHLLPSHISILTSENCSLLLKHTNALHLPPHAPRRRETLGVSLAHAACRASTIFNRRVEVPVLAACVIGHVPAKPHRARAARLPFEAPSASRLARLFVVGIRGFAHGPRVELAVGFEGGVRVPVESPTCWRNILSARTHRHALQALLQALRIGEEPELVNRPLVHHTRQIGYARDPIHAAERRRFLHPVAVANFGEAGDLDPRVALVLLQSHRVNHAICIRVLKKSNAADVRTERLLTLLGLDQLGMHEATPIGVESSSPLVGRFVFTISQLSETPLSLFAAHCRTELRRRERHVYADPGY